MASGGIDAPDSLFIKSEKYRDHCHRLLRLYNPAYIKHNTRLSDWARFNVPLDTFRSFRRRYTIQASKRARQLSEVKRRSVFNFKLGEFEASSSVIKPLTCRVRMYAVMCYCKISSTKASSVLNNTNACITIRICAVKRDYKHYHTPLQCLEQLR